MRWIIREDIKVDRVALPVYDALYAYVTQAK